ncbi:A/G-specific adenine glycosylase [Aerophototrophica crusticola]|uniref:Adenine DNA glycosylase n=1 Tax=Aerophototrophica crusticola TaxID=1709002 RepID=A0A858R8K1_9PROT|nr:A/G-specific adenine glycosylase [Rhodospirillaceae bacterium B3]
MAGVLLGWYDRHARVLPWRAPPGRRMDPYRVWLSEIMLQQTTVATVGPYFQEFTRRWPTVTDLAAAELDDVLRAWAGLGYYARARNLHRCARVVATELGGSFPEDEAGLRQLPGIGAYTAAAVAAIAFDQPAAALDGNVERVLARIYAVADPLPQAKPALQALAAGLVPDQRPGDYTQALFDLGATICTPRKPRCMLCPWAQWCEARSLSIQEELPAKAAKAAKPLRRGVAFFVTDGTGSILLRRRAETGLLGGMMEVPSTGWGAEVPDLDAALAQAPVQAAWRLLPGIVRHTFTHFELELSVLAGRVPAAVPVPDGTWVAPDRLGGEALPTVMAKVVRHGLAHAT